MSETTTPSARADAAPPGEGTSPARAGGRILLALVGGITALLVLGTVLLLTGLVYLGARRLQHDTEGLI